MFSNYITIALRHMAKNKLYASVNLIGLALGLMAYLFGNLLVDYEQSHDMFFDNSERIYTVGSVFSPKVNIGVLGSPDSFTAFRPFYEVDIPELEASARTVHTEFLVSSGDKHFYETIKFADPEFFEIFNFDYIAGDASVLQNPTSVLLTRSAAEKFFGTSDVIGKTLDLDHKLTVRIGAVIEDAGLNSHFRSLLIGAGGMGVVAPFDALNQLNGYDLSGNWNNLAGGDFTYVLLPSNHGQDWLQAEINAVYEARFPNAEEEFVIKLKVAPIYEANTFLYEMIGLPIMDSIKMLAALVLLVAIVNYTNLATAQSMGRIKEVGLRKTMGASRTQLTIQFLVESICMAVFAMVLALSALELMVGWYNSRLDKVMVIDYWQIGPWLILTILAVGLCAGLYPAYNIASTSPIEALRQVKNNRSSLFRSLMLGLQFAISIFMLAMVLVVFLQNRKIESAGEIYPKQQILTLERLGPEEIQARTELLRRELLKLDGVKAMSYSSQLPFLQNNSTRTYSAILGDEDSAFSLNRISIDANFIPLYDMPLMAGRNLVAANANDELDPERLTVNVIINALAAHKLGFASPALAINQLFYDFPTDRAARSHRVVGVLQDQNYQGFHNKIKPTIFMQELDDLGRGSILIAGDDLAKIRLAVETTWRRLIPEYPIKIEFLEQTFQKTYRIFSALSYALFGFSFLAFILSMVGLFGLSAFMAQNRTKEIGLRKVMGASVVQLVQLMIWQFSKPVLWSLLIALPLAYLGSSTYLNFFADKVEFQLPIVMAAGILAVLSAWIIVALHAWRIAGANPIAALRHE